MAKRKNYSRLVKRKILVRKYLKNKGYIRYKLTVYKNPKTKDLNKKKLIISEIKNEIKKSKGDKSKIKKSRILWKIRRSFNINKDDEVFINKVIDSLSNNNSDELLKLIERKIKIQEQQERRLSKKEKEELKNKALENVRNIIWTLHKFDPTIALMVLLAFKKIDLVNKGNPSDQDTNNCLKISSICNNNSQNSSNVLCKGSIRNCVISIIKSFSDNNLLTEDAKIEKNPIITFFNNLSSSKSKEDNKNSPFGVNEITTKESFIVDEFLPKDQDNIYKIPESYKTIMEQILIYSIIDPSLRYLLRIAKNKILKMKSNNKKVERFLRLLKKLYKIYKIDEK